MSSQFSIHSQAPEIALLAAAADAAGRTGTYKSVKNCSGKVHVECRVNQGNAATVTFTVLQAKDSIGTGTKALQGVVPIFFNADTSVSDTQVPQAAATSFTTDAALKDKIVVFEFAIADGLDINNGFNHVAVQTSASNAANITSAQMQFLGRYQQDAPPAAEV